MPEDTTTELEQWKKVAHDLATAITPEQMMTAYDAWSELRGEEEE